MRCIRDHQKECRNDSSVLRRESLATRANAPACGSGKLKKTGESTRAKRGVDLTLPPLSSIEACISHMAEKAVELGLLASIDHLKGRPIRIATMCSGTEAPLLALDLISKG